MSDALLFLNILRNHSKNSALSIPSSNRVDRSSLNYIPNEKASLHIQFLIKHPGKSGNYNDIKENLRNLSSVTGINYRPNRIKMQLMNGNDENSLTDGHNEIFIGFYNQLLFVVFC